MALAIESALRYIVVNDATAGALLSTRVYPMANVPQTTQEPFAAYQLSEEGVHHFGGTSSLVEVDYTLDLYASTYVAVRALGKAVKSALDSYRNTVTIGAESVAIRLCHLIRREYDPESPRDGEEFGEYRERHTYRIGYLDS